MYSEEERLRLEHIVENIDRLAGHIAGISFDDFASAPVLIDAVERCLARITEAAIKLGPEAMRAGRARTSLRAGAGARQRASSRL